MKKNILFIGFGDIASRCAGELLDWNVFAIARREKTVPSHVAFWQGDIQSDVIRTQIARYDFDHVVMTFTPDTRDDAGYKRAYPDNVRSVIDACRHISGRLWFISSTGVYGQNSGEWVNESSAVEPNKYTGVRMREAEVLLERSGMLYSILRFAGIYGPGRYHLLRQVEKGVMGEDGWTNRIHIEDGVGFITHLIKGDSDISIDTHYLVSDSSPERNSTVRLWLANQLGVDLHGSEGILESEHKNKRCDNQRMLATGYELRYPSYREGYLSVIKNRKSE